jgi:hypothetical protein
MSQVRGWRPDLPQQTWLLIALAGAAVIPAAVAAALVPVRSSAPNATIALVLAALVTVLAVVGTRLTAAVAAISASIGFDVFQTRPYGSFAITRTQDIETTGLLLVVGLVVGQLAARNRRHRDRAAEMSFDLSRIHAVAEMVAAGDPADQVVTAVASEISGLLRLRSCRFETSFAERPGPFIERHGAVTWGALHWGFGTMGLPSKEVSLVVQHQGLPLGRFVLLAEPGTVVTPDQLLTAVALADQAGAALAGQGLPGTAGRS